MRTTIKDPACWKPGDHATVTMHVDGSTASGTLQATGTGTTPDYHLWIPGVGLIVRFHEEPRAGADIVVTREVNYAVGTVVVPAGIESNALVGVKTNDSTPWLFTFNPNDYYRCDATQVWWASEREVGTWLADGTLVVSHDPNNKQSEG